MHRQVTRLWQTLGLSWVVFLLAGCPAASQTTIVDAPAQARSFDWQLPERIPEPVVPDDNPLTEAKFQLGRHLFYEQRLSADGTLSCASCHQQDKAFSDGVARPSGVTGEVHPRNSQALANAAWHPRLTWANPVLDSLEKQIVLPLFGENPIEHGINDHNRDGILHSLAIDPTYQSLVVAAYPEAESAPAEALTWQRIVQALASFVRGLTSFNSPFDRFEAGDRTALDEAQQRGMSLFFSERLECFHCHGGYNLTNSVMDRTRLFPELSFHNTGLYNIDGLGAYPFPNTGVHEITGAARDMGKFRAPSLRNVALTAPYGHDGSLTTLEDVIDAYSAGGRVLTTGPHPGDGRLNPNKDGFVVGFTLTDQERADLLAFLHALTDDSFVNNPRFANPWVDQ